MTITPPIAGMTLLATTGPGGYVKQNATPNILTWNVPNDGAMHRFMIIASEQVTVAETGGAISSNFTNPGGNANVPAGNIFTGSKAIGGYHSTDGSTVQAGTQVVLLQSTAMTAGTTTLWAEIWGN